MQLSHRGSYITIRLGRQHDEDIPYSLAISRGRISVGPGGSMVEH